MANIKARRKLSDLYKRGVEVRFDGERERIAPGGEGYFVDEDGKKIPPEPGEIQMWVQPPSPFHREMAMRDAQAARAKAMVRAKREEDSEEHLTIMAFLADMSDETLIEYLLLQDTEERRADAIREVLGEDEWQEMTAYQDALREYDDSEKSIEELQEDPEWVALMELDIKFGNQVSEREQEMMNAARDALEMQMKAGRAGIERKALKRRAEMVGTQAFMAEYEHKMLFYACRDFEDQGVMFFESARELAEQDEAVRRIIQAALQPFIADSTEAKNLQGVVSGLGSSEPPSKQETSEASTPETASA